MTLSTFVAIGLAAQATIDGQADPAVRDWHAELRPGYFEHLRQQAGVRCVSSSVPNECGAALMAASYSETRLLMCMERVGERFLPWGRGTPYYRDETRRTCHDAIRQCRDNWRHFHDLSGWLERWPLERRQEILRLNLDDNCFGEAPENAPD